MVQSTVKRRHSKPPRRGGGSCMNKRSGIPVVLGANKAFWSHLGCWWRNVTIISCQSTLYGALEEIIIKEPLSFVIHWSLEYANRACSWTVASNRTYYTSKLVRALWLVYLASRTILHGPLKFKVFSSPNCCVIYHQIFSSYDANNSLKLSFTLNCVLKRANDLKTISNWFVLLSPCFRNLKGMEIVPEHVRHTTEIQ